MASSSSSPSNNCQGFINLFDADDVIIKQFVFLVDKADNKSTSIHTKKHFFVSIFGDTGEDPNFKTQEEFSEYIKYECAQVTKVQLKLGERFVREFNVKNLDELLASIRRIWSQNVNKKRTHVEHAEVEYISDEDKDKSDESDAEEADSSAKRAEATARALEVWKFAADLQKKLSNLAQQGKTMDDGEACLAGIELASILKGDRLVFNRSPYTDSDQMSIVNMCNEIGMTVFSDTEQVSNVQAASKAYDLVKLLCFQ